MVTSLVSAVAGPVAVAAPLHRRPDVQSEKSVPHKDFPLQKPPSSSKQDSGTPSADLPAAGDAEVSLTATAAGRRPAQRAGTTPVLLGRAAQGTAPNATSDPSPANFHVHLADQSVTHKAGISGVLFTVAPTGAGATQATVGVDYSRFRDAGGGDFGNRLHLVGLPACALTTPEVAACRVQTPLPGNVNDGKAGVVSAEVTFAGAKPAATSGAQQSAMPAVVAATPGPSGPNGTFTATSLAPSGTWSVGGATGNFTWTYPIATPPPAAGGDVAPSVGLSYDSSGVDGHVASTNDQPSWIGEGWDYNAGYLERTYRPCADDPAGTSGKTTDQCWAGQILTLNLGGQSTPLVHDDAHPDVWRPTTDNGARVERLTGADNGALDGEYWRVTTTDGLQHYLGLNKLPGAGDQRTNSTWTTRVYGAHSGEPCNSSAGFAASSCTQAYRWNVDLVEDLHHNATAYYYTTEKNFYGANNATAGVEYTRGGSLSRIDYGLRDVGGVYGAPAPDQVVFTTSERCTPADAVTCDPAQFTKDNAKYWPDTPQDQKCDSGATCDNHSPTFWSTKRLTNITTQYYNGSGYTKVDSYDLGQKFFVGQDPAMWLNSLNRTGFTPDGHSVTTPPLSFDGQAMDNRVLNYNNQPAMIHRRMTQITTDTGSIIKIGYTTPDCTSSHVPADPAHDTMRCFPVYWTPAYDTTPILDYFHKYLTTSVELQEPHAVSPSQASTYTYVGDPAWHFDDNELVKPANRTYGQFRGYGKVEVRTGAPAGAGQQTLTTTTYYRGMGGTVPDSLGGTVPDDNIYADQVRETEIFDGSGGAHVSATISDLVTVATTASRARAGLPALTANIVATGKKRMLTDLAAGGTRQSTTTTGYDSLGRVVRQNESADGLPDLCTSTTYAENLSSWVRASVAETIKAQQTCPAPDVPLTASAILSDQRHFYDNLSATGVVGDAAEPTRTDTATVNTGGALTWVTTNRASYDSSGRTLSTTDGRGYVTKQSYVPAEGGVLGQTTTTNAKNQTTTVTLEGGHGKTTSAVNVAGQRTDADYDGLGRLISLWLPGHAKATQPASTTYSYLLQNTGPISVTTKTLVDFGTGTNYVTAVEIYDALGQSRQKQVDAEGGGRVVTDSFYDGHGWKSQGNDAYQTDGAPATTMIAVADSQVPSRHVLAHDGTGRLTEDTSYHGLNATWSTKTVYGGDRTTTVPPAGGIESTTLIDASGKTVETRQYTAPPVISGNVVSGGTYDATSYHYAATGQQDRVTDPGGSVWSYGFDMLGHRTSQTDPDSGTSTSTYDTNGNLATTTDGRGQTLAYDYDELDRKTAEYLVPATGPKQKLASWVYDTLQAGKQTYSTRSTPNGDFRVGVTGYDDMGNPRGQIVGVPAGEQGFAGNYTTTFAWSTTNLLLTSTPPAIGGLPAESIATSYDKLGNPTTTTGYNAYVSASSYTPLGEAQQYTLGPSNNQAWLTYDRDAQTRKITKVDMSAQRAASGQLDDTTYTYNAAGNITRSVDVEGQTGAPTQTQCYGYDPLDRLTQSWTATDNCAAAPSTTSGSSNIGGPNPFWTSWTFDKAGLRKNQVQHALPGTTGGDTTTTYTYPAAGSAQPHTLSSTTTTAPTGTSSASYGYDKSGNTTGRTLPTGQQTLTWDAENRLATVTTTAGETSYVYDADGNQLLRRDPANKTLFINGQELVRDNATGKLSGTRYYKHNSTTVAMRVGGANPQYLVSDLHDTSQVAVDSSTFAVTRRAIDPYGNPLGNPTSTWPDSHGFLDKPTDAATGLTDVGARKYDATTGRFISRDAITEKTDPTQLNGYAYAGDNPVNQADPTGMSLWSWVGDHIDTISTVLVVAVVVVAVVVAAPVALPALAAAAEVATEATAVVGAAVETSTAAATAASAAEGAATAFAATGSPAMAAIGAASNALTTAAPAILGSGAAGTIAMATGAVVSEFVGASNSLGPRGGCANSFAAGTAVLMADGTTKAIEDVRVGDQVTNAEPGSDRTERHTVTDIHVTDTDRAFDDLTVDTALGPQTITSTAQHLYYDETTHSWTPAQDLKIGDLLQGPHGEHVRVLANRHYTAKIRTYNLTVDRVHTFYIVAGTQPVLVHNQNRCVGTKPLEGEHLEGAKDAIAHFRQGHGPGASQTRGEVGEFDKDSVFMKGSDEEVSELLEHVVLNSDSFDNPSTNTEGNGARHVHFAKFDDIVGTDFDKGSGIRRKTRWVMIVVDDYDDHFVTAYPVSQSKVANATGQTNAQLDALSKPASATKPCTPMRCN
ncbi:RHS repeat-associated core domain-containing protein [Amycolatopsis mediterranei]|uniref:RHS repeat-containing protein n=1 Tax=Amycolatopsis mediterranei (strain S699) TaxID=713604 RepID=A0A9R0P4C2_AMYMS|nr:RHS repeat-associated core domain-containing protein [Amycolatopsis mediterranei]AEK46022.1 RHS repeat-containing protein [Amycolatopsis mediterranei S699]UZF74097.1 polymorphic toxin-type HINT domain-containing protein [Amycolatopsis mediterranei]